MIDFNKYKLSTGTHYIANSGSDENKEYKGARRATKQATNGN